MIRTGGLYAVFAADNASDTMFLHEPGHAWPGDCNALFPKVYCYSGTTIAAITLRINFSNENQYLLFSFHSSANRVLAPVIIATAAYP